MNTASQGRSFFKDPSWVLGKDGSPENPKADKNCKKCRGHGIVDDGDNYGACLINCPVCCPPRI